ncbi:hypothetical protein [Brevundimonas sp. TWP2-3-4b1]|uniref:hypothetical protein n=1 Tax=Brevundimonas sp. TWP2-3-4b1 TaxID=2804580 RepID=UPI003CF1DFB1
MSGAISFNIQKREHERADALRKADLLLKQKSIAHRLIVKLLGIYSDLVKLQEHLKDEFRKQSDNLSAEPWSFVIPMFVSHGPIEFDGEETALYLDLEMNEAFNIAGALPRIHKNLFDIMRAYGEKREQLRLMLPADCFTSKGLRMTEEQSHQTAPLRMEMNNLITWAFGSIDRDVQDAKAALQSTAADMTKALGLKMNLSLDDEVGLAA